MNVKILRTIKTTLELLTEAQETVLHVVAKHPYLPPPDHNALNRAARQLMQAQQEIDSMEVK
jgi:LmbE family N-acetylglucosaminyl deacetylase